MARRKLTPLEEFQAWVFLHGGWQKALRAYEAEHQKDFSQAPIKAFVDARVKSLARRRRIVQEQREINERKRELNKLKKSRRRKVAAR